MVRMGEGSKSNDRELASSDEKFDSELVLDLDLQLDWISELI